MNLVKAKYVEESLLYSFLDKNEAINRTAIEKFGYVVIKEEEIIGCFILQGLKSDRFWLKQLFITKQEASNLPKLLQEILYLAEENYAKEVYVHSHQPMVDWLLQSLQFHPKKQALELGLLPKERGTWWTYKITS